MNAMLDLIEHRRSIRKYAKTPITTEEKETILHAAMRAPTAGNMMLYSIIEVEEQSLKDKLALTCDHQPFIASAPFVLLFLADYQRWVDLFNWSGAPQASHEKGVAPRPPQEGDLLLACCDALIAAQTAVLAAESLGIGSCYIGDIMENAEEHRAMFSLPQYTLPICLLCFGRPYVTHEPQRQVPRFDPSFIVHHDRYQPPSPEKFPHMLQNLLRQTSDPDPEAAAKAYVQALYSRKFVSDFSVEMTRSVRLWINAWNGSSFEGSPGSAGTSSAP